MVIRLCCCPTFLILIDPPFYFFGHVIIVKQFDENYRIWDKAIEMDQRFKIQEKMELVMKKAQEALNTPTGQKIHGLANQTMSHIAAVHYEAKRIQNDKLGISDVSKPNYTEPLVTSSSATTTMPLAVAGSA